MPFTGIREKQKTRAEEGLHAVNACCGMPPSESHVTCFLGRPTGEIQNSVGRPRTGCLLAQTGHCGGLLVHQHSQPTALPNSNMPRPVRLQHTL
eukprot:6465495-Alexandrium_andersonii.AAC.1